MNEYRKKIFVMSNDELDQELKKLQDHHEYFQRADGNYRDPVETRMRKKNGQRLQVIHKEINKRKIHDVGSTHTYKTIEEKRHDNKKSK